MVRFFNSTDYEEHEVIKFPISYGLPKTIAIDEFGRLAVGFVGNGVAYFLVLIEKDRPSLVFDSFNSAAPLFEYSDQEVAKAKPFSITATYERYCAMCHEGGRYGAPARGNIEAWERFPRDLNLLADLAIEGRGAMMPRGGCQECTTSDLKAVIEYMLPITW